MTKTFDSAIERYLALLDALKQAVIATDSVGAIIHWNRSAEELYGWPPDEVMGKNVLDVTPVELSRGHGAEIMQALARGEIWSGEFRVQNRSGRSFIASVTDVPLLDESRGVSGVIGVSAPSQTPTVAGPLLKRLSAACDKVWPKQIKFKIGSPKTARIAAAEPHLIQLLSLLLLRYVEALNRGEVVEVVAGTSEQSPFSDFGLIPGTEAPALYIRMDRRDQSPNYSVLRTVSWSAEPTRYVSILVRMVGGMLIAGTAPDETSAMHLFLPFQ